MATLIIPDKMKERLLKYMTEEDIEFWLEEALDRFEAKMPTRKNDK